MKEVQIGFNCRLVYNKYDQMDGDLKGWYFVVDNENMRPMIKKIAKKKYTNVAIPMYSFFLGEEKKQEIIKSLTR